MNSIGILAYGSLIKNPGVEIQPLIVRRIPTQTPFPVEYARWSNSRGGGPTVVPHPSGKPVRAEILVLRDGLCLAEAKDMLWRREVRKEGTGRHYAPGDGPKSVLVKDWPGFQGIGHVLYTDFPPSGKVPSPNPQALAKAALSSVAKAPVGKDGISYLIELTESGVETALTGKYREEILRETGAANLLQAIKQIESERTKTVARGVMNMDMFCYRHPKEIAVARIERLVQQHTPDGIKEVTIRSYVCKQCAEGARSVGTPLLSLVEKPQE